MRNLWMLAIWRCLLIFHQNRTTNTLRVPRKERIASHRLIDFHVAKCTLGSFSNAHLSHDKPTSEMVFEVVFQPPHGTMTSKSFNIDTNSPCSGFPFTVGPVGDLLTTWPAGVSWCVYPYEDHQLFKIWWLLGIHVRGGTVTYHLKSFKCAKSPKPLTLKESDIPPPVRHSTLERSCPCEKGSRCLNPNNSGSQIQIHLNDASFRCITTNSLSRGGTGKVSHTHTNE